MGQRSEIKIQLREEDFSPKLKDRVKLTVYDPDGVKIDSPLQESPQPSEYTGSFMAAKEGIYKVRVETPLGSREESRMIGEPLESRDAAPDHEKLEKIATATGGKVLSKSENLLKEVEDAIGKGERHFWEETKMPIWGSLYGFITILALLSSEWYLRRRWGLI